MKNVAHEVMLPNVRSLVKLCGRCAGFTTRTRDRRGKEESMRKVSRWLSGELTALIDGIADPRAKSN